MYKYFSKVVFGFVWFIIGIYFKYNGIVIMMNKVMEEWEMIKFDKLFIFYYICVYVSLYYNF